MLRKGEPYKNFARRLLDSKGEFSEEQVDTIVKQVYGIEYNKPPFIFEEKMPGRMLDSNKWKRTRVHEIVDGRPYPYEAKEPRTITGKTYNIENSSQRSASNPCNTGKQIITRPSKEKYDYLPQFH